MSFTNVIAANAVTGVSIASKKAPEIIGAWNPSTELQQWGKWIAAALLTFWVLYILFKLVTPKKGATRQINWVGLAMSGVVAMLLMNMSAIPDIINNVAALFYGIAGFFGWQ